MCSLVKLHHRSIHSPVCQYIWCIKYLKGSDSHESILQSHHNDIGLSLIEASDSTIFDPWDGSWKIKFHVIFLLFLPFFVTAPCFLLTFSLTLRYQPHHVPLPPSFRPLTSVGLLVVSPNLNLKRNALIMFHPPLPPCLCWFS